MTDKKALVSKADNGEGPRKRRPPNPISKSKAKQLYLRYTSYDSISEQLQLPRETIIRWSNDNHWITERKQAEIDLVREYIDQKAGRMSEISSISLDLIISSLRNIKAEGKPLKLSEAKTIAEIFTQVDKIIKLDTGQATERTEVKAATVQDLREALSLDAFIDVTPTKKEDNG